MRVLSPVRSTVFCVSVAALLPVSVWAQTGQITGQIDGTAIDLTLGTPDADEPGFFINRYAGGGFTELDVDLLAISEGAAGYEGVMIGLSFDADGDMALSDFTPDMLFDAEVMLIEDWPSDQIDPTAVWLANLEVPTRWTLRCR